MGPRESHRNHIPRSPRQDTLPRFVLSRYPGCEKGISRSTAFVVAYLMRKDRRSRDEVLADVRLKRKVRPSENFMTQPDSRGRMEHDVWEDSEGKVPKAPQAPHAKLLNLTAVFKNAGEIMFGS